ncbi:hypothetical protein MK489_19770 [Myxococcota bacterium]|nr:hypothetical protein [Myxococcota bacterium]
MDGKFERDKRLLLSALAVTLVLGVAFPGSYRPLATGLDPSVHYALNQLALSQHLFGRDVVFPYGPLGYLLTPLDLGDNLLRAIALWCVVHGLFALGILLAVRRGAGILQVFAFAFSYLLAFTLGLVYEYQLLAVIGLWMTLSLTAHSPRMAALCSTLAGMSAGFCLLVKLSLGLSALGMLVVAEGLRGWTQGPRRIPTTLATFGAFTSTSLLLSAVHLSSFSNLFEWMRRSYELTSGFSAAMSFSGPMAGLWFGGITLGLFALLSLVLRKHEPMAWRASLLFLVPVLFSFRHGFVRHDGHVQNFFPFVLAALSVQLLFCRNRRETMGTTAAALLVAVLALPTYAPTGLLDFQEMARRGSGWHGAGNMLALARLKTTRARLESESRVNLEANRLPNAWVEAIHERQASLDVVPWEISYAPANDLPWDPNPVLQTYAAYTAFLDRASAQHYAAADAPGFVLLEFMSLDGRHPLLDAPATTRELLTHYSLVASDFGRRRILLAHPGDRSPSALTPVGQTRARTREWVSVPNSDRLLFGELEMQPTMRGRIQQALFRVPPVRIEVVYADGEQSVHRIIPDTARNGFLLNFLPRSTRDAAALFRGTGRNRVVRFRIGGPGASLYLPEFDVAWKVADSQISEPSAP